MLDHSKRTQRRGWGGAATLHYAVWLTGEAHGDSGQAALSTGTRFRLSTQTAQLGRVPCEPSRESRVCAGGHVFFN